MSEAGGCTVVKKMTWKKIVAGVLWYYRANYASMDYIYVIWYERMIWHAIYYIYDVCDVISYDKHKRQYDHTYDEHQHIDNVYITWVQKKK